MATEYTTWENDFLSSRWELHRQDGSLIAVVDKTGKKVGKRAEWGIWKDDVMIGTRLFEEDAKRAAEGLI